MERGTVDKIVDRYFRVFAVERFSYAGETIQPKPLIVSPTLFRGFICPPNCGACCPRFSLDYLPDEEHPEGLRQQLYGRGWSLTRVDGEKGALCEMTKATRETTEEVVRKLERLLDWTEHFGLKTRIPEVLDWVRSGPHAVKKYFD